MAAQPQNAVPRERGVEAQHVDEAGRDASACKGRGRPLQAALDLRQLAQELACVREALVALLGQRAVEQRLQRRVLGQLGPTHREPRRRGRQVMAQQLVDLALEGALTGQHLEHQDAE